MPNWQDSAADSSYSHFFGLQRLQGAAVDICKSATLSQQSNAISGNITTRVRRLDFRTLSHPVSDHVRLDLSFVDSVLCSTGPVLPRAWDINWQWEERPSHVKTEAATEHDYYSWLEWILFAPGAHAVSAVRDKLYLQAQMEVPEGLRGRSATESIYGATTRGTTDILHFIKADGQQIDLTAHEVKRTRVLMEGGDVLEHLVVLAGGSEGWAFRQGNASLDKRARSLLSQCIDELIHYDVTHIIVTTPEKYVLLLLDNSHQFQVSRVYTIYDSTTQGRDMAELVLFYTHALLNQRPPYPQSRLPSIPVYRVTIPAFSPHLFQPQEALLCNGRLIHRAKLAILGRAPEKSVTRPLSIQFHTFDAVCRHDGEVVISFGRLVFWLFETHIVAKAAYQSSALDRLSHEFAVYQSLRTLQGVVIPSLFGMYRNLDDGSTILVTSYAGVTLQDFGTLGLKDRRTLLLRVVRLHQAGVLHNDLEPRNVVLSKHCGPRIIDFDNATLNHTCGGSSCKELSELSLSLGLDLVTELSRTELSQATRSWVLIPLLYLLLFILYMVKHIIQ